MTRTPIGTYRCDTAIVRGVQPPPFAAYDKEGRAWHVTEEEAEQIGQRIEDGKKGGKK